MAFCRIINEMLLMMKMMMIVMRIMMMRMMKLGHFYLGPILGRGAGPT